VTGIPPSTAITDGRLQAGWQPSPTSHASGMDGMEGIATGQGNKYIGRIVSYSTLVVVNSYKFISYLD